jgi:hypothetical protein
MSETPGKPPMFSTVAQRRKKMTKFMTKTAAVAFLALFFVFFHGSAAFPQGSEIHPKKNDDNLYGYVDANGKWVIEPRFEAANPFSANGSAWVRLEKGKYGSIDKTGKIGLALTPDIYDFESVSPDGVVVATAVNKPGDYDRFSGFVGDKGWIAEPVFRDLKPLPGTGLFQARDKNGMAVLLNENGKVAMKTNGQIIGRHKDVIVATSAKDGRALFGFADMKGKWIVKPSYEFIHADGESDYMTVVGLNGKAGVIDNKGKIIVAPEFNEIRPGQFANFGLTAAADSNGKYGFIDKNSEWVIKPRFVNAENFSKIGLANVVVTDRKEGYIDSKGEFAIAPEFLDASEFSDVGLAPVRAANGKWGLIEENGEFAVSPRYDVIYPVRTVDGTALFAALDKNKFGLINAKGDLIVKPSLSMVETCDKRGFCLAKRENGPYGFIDATGKWLIEPKFDSLEPFGDLDHAVAEVPGKGFGLIDRRGNLIMEPIFKEMSPFGKDLVKVLFEGDYDDMNYHYLNLRGEARVPVGYDAKREK